MNLVEKLGDGLTGLEQLKAMLAMGGRAPIGETLDFTFVDFLAAHVRLTG